MEAIACPGARVCRCGTHLAAGRSAFELVGLSDPLLPLFPDRIFCSVGCLRAEFFEKRELLDAMIGSPAEALVTDLRRTYAEFNRAFEGLGEHFHLLSAV